MDNTKIRIDIYSEMADHFAAKSDALMLEMAALKNRILEAEAHRFYYRRQLRRLNPAALHEAVNVSISAKKHDRMAGGVAAIPL